MIFSGNLKEHHKTRSLMRISPEFPYPVEPDCKSILVPQIQSNEEIPSNAAISILLINCVEQDNFLPKSDPFKHIIKDQALFNEIGPQKLKSDVLTYIGNQTVQLLIFLSLIFLPVQIALISDEYVLLHLIIPIVRIMLHLNCRRISKFKKYIRKSGIQTIVLTNLSKQIIVICIFTIKSQLNYLYSWFGYFIYFISYTSIIKKIYSQIIRVQICLAPEYSWILLIIRLIFFTHVLNCYVFQLINQQKSDQINYFECLYITLCLMTNANLPSGEITKEMQLVTFASYFYIIYLLLQIAQVRNDIPIYFIEKQEIPFSTRFKIFDELNSTHSQKLLKQLSPNLINLIHHEQFQQFIKSNFESYDSFEQIAQICEVLQFNEGQKIIELNQKDDCSIYFILKGEIRVMLNKFQFKTLSEKCTFGQLSFYTQQGRTATIICSTKCSVIKLSREAILSVLKNKNLERFHLIKDEILFSNLLPKQIQCYYCEESTHVILNCPKIQYLMQNKKIIELHNQNIIQDRSKCVRKSWKNVRIIIANRCSEQFKLKSKQVLNTTSISSDLQANSEHQKINKDDGASGNNSSKLIGDQLFAEQHGPIQVLSHSSENRVFSLQDIQIYQKTIPEISIESSRSSIQLQYSSLPKPQINNNQKTSKEEAYSLQKYHISESSINLSPIFEKKQTNPSSNLIQGVSKRGNYLKSKNSSYSGKFESGFRSGLSSFQAISHNENPLNSRYFFYNEIDKMHIFEVYYPTHNYDKKLVAHD